MPRLQPNPVYRHQPVRGALFIAFAMFLFACQDALLKELSTTLPVLQMLAVRTAVVAVLLTVAAIACGPAAWRAKQPWPLLLRGTLAFLAFSSYYLALAVIPLAEASAVYLSAPLFVTLLSVPLLRERVGRHRALAVLCGFVGVMIVINPSAALFRVEAAIPLFSALCYALIPIITRRYGAREHALALALYTTVPYLFWIGVTSAGFALFTGGAETSNTPQLLSNLMAPWTALSGRDAASLGLAALFFLGGLLSITEAYRTAAVSAIAPFEYTHLLWSMALGIWIFSDSPSPSTLVGGAVIVASGCYVAYREHRHRTET